VALHPDWLLNAGALTERSNVAGSTTSPRVMINWKAATGHTLRAGTSRALRPPSSFERYANVRYFLGGTLADSTYVARGNVVAEQVYARELGYLAELAERRVVLDVRVFDERVRNFIQEIDYSLPGSGGNNLAKDFVNGDPFSIQGYETQLRWKPWPVPGGVRGSRLSSGQSYGGSNLVGRYGTQGVMFMQQFPRGWQATLIQHEADADPSPRATAPGSPAYHRTDAARGASHAAGWPPGRTGPRGPEPGPSYQDFMPKLLVQTRAYVQLKVEN
jgi:iron complex outermembrane recepter protein